MQTKVTKADAPHTRMHSLSLYLSLASRASEKEDIGEEAELLTYYTVTAANATGQQYGRVRVARVQPLIPHVFSHPSCSDASASSHPICLYPRTGSDYAAGQVGNWISGSRR